MDHAILVRNHTSNPKMEEAVSLLVVENMLIPVQIHLLIMVIDTKEDSTITSNTVRVTIIGLVPETTTMECGSMVLSMVWVS